MDPRILFVILSILTTALSAPQRGTNSVQDASPAKETQPKILKQINKVNPDGSYQYGFEAEDGSYKVETRDKNGVVRGKYGFIDANGELKNIEYTAGQPSPTSASAEDDQDQRIAAQTPSGKALAATQTKAKEEEATSSEDDDGKSGNDGFNGEDFRSFGAQQQNPQIYSQGQRQGQGLVQGSPFVGGGSPYIGDPQGFQGQGFQGGPQYVPTGQGQFLGGPQQFQGQGGPGGFSGQPQFQGRQPQLGGFQGSQFGQPQGGFRGQSFDGLSGGQFNGPTSGGFPILSSQGGQAGRGQFSGQALSGQNGGDGEYVGNPELDGFSEDADQDGYVDAFPGSGQVNQGTARAVAEGAEKTPVVKTPNALRTSPQQVLRVQNNPSLQGQGQIQGPGGQPIFFNGQGQPGQQLTEDQIQALYQGQGFQGVNQQGLQGGVRPGIPQSSFGGQGGQFNQFNPQFNPQSQQAFSPQGFPIQQQGFPQQFSGAGQQFSPGQFPIQGQTPQSQNQGQGGIVQIQGGQFSPSTPQGGSGTFTSGPSQSQFNSPQGVQGSQNGIPFGAINGGGQQFSPVQNFLPQGVQGQGGIPPQFLQQQGGQQFNGQQFNGQQGLQSPGFPFDYNPYGGAGPYQGGGFPGQFGAGPYIGGGGVGVGGGIQQGQIAGVQPGQVGQISNQGPQSFLLGGGQQQSRVINAGSPGSGGAASAQKPVSESADEKKST